MSFIWLQKLKIVQSNVMSRRYSNDFDLVKKHLHAIHLHHGNKLNNQCMYKAWVSITTTVPQCYNLCSYWRLHIIFNHEELIDHTEHSLIRPMSCYEAATQSLYHVCRLIFERRSCRLYNLQLPQSLSQSNEIWSMQLQRPESFSSRKPIALLSNYTHSP